MGNFEMTYNEAIEIQRKQIEYYRPRGFTAEMEQKLKAKTLPCPGDPDEKMPMHKINELVPRGASLEYLMGLNTNYYD